MLIDDDNLDIVKHIDSMQFDRLACLKLPNKYIGLKIKRQFTILKNVVAVAEKQESRALIKMNIWLCRSRIYTLLCLNRTENSCGKTNNSLKKYLGARTKEGILVCSLENVA